MGEIDEHTLAALLPGTWRIAATNFPMWLSGERLEPTFTYGLVSSSPLVLDDDVSYVVAPNAAKDAGGTKHILGRDTWRDGEFVWRGTGLLKLVSSRWEVSGMSDDGTIAVVHFAKSIATPAGVDVLSRDGVHGPELRALVAHTTEQLGLTPEEFGSLTWLTAGR